MRRPRAGPTGTWRGPSASSSRSRRRRVRTPAPRELRIGTRGSSLALRQTEIVADALRAAWTGLGCRIIPISTRGDRDLDRPIPVFGGKGVFTAEIEAALEANAVDLAVHSLKDLPTAERPGVAIGAVTRRDEPGDALISRGGEGLERLATGARVGTSSLRRAAQLRAARPDLRLESIRGNVETRLRKLEEGIFDAIVLARAGLRRLGLEHRISEALAPDVLLPAPGQGAIAVQRRAADGPTARLLEPLHDTATWAAVRAERAFLAALEAGCSAPVAALAEVGAERIQMRGLAADADGRRIHRVAGTGDPADPEELGRRLAAEVRAAGGAADGDLPPFAG